MATVGADVFFGNVCMLGNHPYTPFAPTHDLSHLNGRRGRRGRRVFFI
jgi:hypothetical protein